MVWVEKVIDFFKSELKKRYIADQSLKAEIQQCEAKRKKIAAEISELESLLEKAIVIISKENRVIETNDIVEQVTGYPLRFIVGKNLSKLIPPDSFDEFSKKIASEKNFEIQFSIPERTARKTGLAYRAINAEVVVRDDYNAAVLEKLFDYTLCNENGQKTIRIIADEVVDFEKCRAYLTAVLDWSAKGKIVQVDFKNTKRFKSAAVTMVYHLRHLLGDFSKVFLNFPMRRYEAVVETYKKLLKRIASLEDVLSISDYSSVLKARFKKMFHHNCGELYSILEEGLRKYISIEREELATFAKKISKIEKADEEIAQKRETMLKEMFKEQHKAFNKLYYKVLQELLEISREKPAIVSLGTLTDPPSINGESYRAFAKYEEKKSNGQTYHVLAGYELEPVKNSKS